LLPLGSLRMILKQFHGIRTKQIVIFCANFQKKLQKNFGQQSKYLTRIEIFVKMKFSPKIEFSSKNKYSSTSFNL